MKKIEFFLSKKIEFLVSTLKLIRGIKNKEWISLKCKRPSTSSLISVVKYLKKDQKLMVF